MATMKVYKVSALPTPLEANAVYFVKDGTSHFQMYLVDSGGTVTTRPYADVKSFDFNRYDLPTATSTGVMDLSLNQIFKINASTAGTINLSFTNAPAAAKAMVIVIEVTGNAATIGLPANVTVTDGVDTTLGALQTIITLFFDGTKFFLINSSRINA